MPESGVLDIVELLAKAAQVLGVAPLLGQEPFGELENQLSMLSYGFQPGNLGICRPQLHVSAEGLGQVSKEAMMANLVLQDQRHQVPERGRSGGVRRVPVSLEQPSFFFLMRGKMVVELLLPGSCADQRLCHVVVPFGL